MNQIHPSDRLDDASRQLCGRMKEAGVERTPAELAASLLDMSGNSHELATWTAFQYLSLKRPIGELILKTSELGKSDAAERMFQANAELAAIDDRPTWPMLTWSSCITFIAGSVIGFLLAS